MKIVTDGVEAFDFFKARGEHADAPIPDLVLLDLGLPARSGEQVLQEMRADAELRGVPVVVLSGDDDPDTVRAAYRDGANAYVGKPDDYEGMVEIVEALSSFWLTVALLPDVTPKDQPNPPSMVDGDGDSGQ